MAYQPQTISTPVRLLIHKLLQNITKLA